MAVPGHQRKISVGILEADRVEFSLGGETVFLATECDGQVVIDGEARPEWYFAEGCAGRADRAAGADNVDNQRNINNASPDSVGGHFGEIAKNETVTLQSKQYFTLKNVEIGKGFHWQRYQDQSFPGDLKLIARHGRVIAINVVGIEDYLQCVIASEMSPSAGFEFLKAHAVISRSWLLAQLDKRDDVLRLAAAGKNAEVSGTAAAGKSAGAYSSVECDTPDELIRWQDREDHEWFDFCADDHCQRYQGIPMSMAAAMAPGAKSADTEQLTNNRSPQTGHGDSLQCADTQDDALQGGAKVDPAMLRKTKRVIEATWGQVLWYDGRVCDARFSKCCGGALEEFKYCWENKEVPYLKYARDRETTLAGGGRKPDGLLVAQSNAAAGAQTDLRQESAARKWILSSPRAFCNTRSARLLGQVLKDYDSETKDFYRWRVEYTAEELRQIILERTGEDYGEIRDLIPLERGVSGRICRLRIVGSKKTKIIGKELEIRKTLSRSHLYSSAFVVEKVYEENAGGKLVDNKEDAQINGTAEGYRYLGQVVDSQMLCCHAGAGVAGNDGNGSAALPVRFILHGAGWGHGVGLCQIGAAAMGARGYDYRTILQHYYPGSTISTHYGEE